MGLLTRFFSNSSSNLAWRGEGWSIAKSQISENEDAFLVAELGKQLLVVLADGQGGRPGGALAARTAIQAVQDTYCASAGGLSWVALGAEVDRAVSGFKGAGFTTLLAFMIAGGRLCGISNGDSVLMVRNSPEGAKYLNENQPKNPPVGSGAAEFCEMNFSLDRESWLVCATDGMWRPSSIPSLSTWTAHRTSAAELKLRYEAGSKGFADDATAIVIWPEIRR